VSELDQYLRHLERYGPECIMDTAARDPEMAREDLGVLKGQLDFWARTHRWKAGRWEPRRTDATIRSCEHCKRDIPRQRGSRARFCSDACRNRARRARSGA
jgi:hypothetical protein